MQGARLDVRSAALRFVAGAAAETAQRDVRAAREALHREQGRRSARERPRAGADRGRTGGRRRGPRRAAGASRRSWPPCRGSRSSRFWSARSRRLASILAAASGMASKPIVTVNLWYDRAVMDDLFVGLPGREMQWVFDKRRVFGEAASHLSLVASGADALVGADTATLVALAAREVAAAIPGARDAVLQARHRHPREARDLLPGARINRRARASTRPSTGSSSPATGSKPVFRAQSRARPPRDTWRPLSIQRPSAAGISPMKSVIIHYQEIALKGKNRPWFVARLVRNIRAATSDLDITELRVLMGRIELVLGPAATWEQARDRVSPGLRHRQLRARRPRAARHRRDRRRDPERPRAREPGDVPRVGQARRQAFSLQLARRSSARSAAAIKEARGWPVNLGDPELTIHVEALTHDAFYSFGKVRGPGGLPVGTSGRVACLLSGGIDSPVAAWRMMRRGCRVLFVHFHSYPILSRASQEKARELARLLTRFQFRFAALPRALRRDPAAGRPRRAAAAAGRDLPAPDDADRRADRAACIAPRRSSPATWSARSPRRRSRTWRRSAAW